MSTNHTLTITYILNICAELMRITFDMDASFNKRVITHESQFAYAISVAALSEVWQYSSVVESLNIQSSRVH